MIKITASKSEASTELGDSMKTLLDPTSIKTGQAIRWESSTEERSLVYHYVAQHDGQGCGIPTEGRHFLMG